MEYDIWTGFRLKMIVGQRVGWDKFTDEYRTLLLVVNVLRVEGTSWETSKRTRTRSRTREKKRTNENKYQPIFGIGCNHAWVEGHGIASFPSTAARSVPFFIFLDDLLSRFVDIEAITVGFEQFDHILADHLVSRVAQQSLDARVGVADVELTVGYSHQLSRRIGNGYQRFGQSQTLARTELGRVHHYQFVQAGSHTTALCQALKSSQIKSSVSAAIDSFLLLISW